MKRLFIVLTLTILLFSKTVFCAEWPEAPSQNATPLQTFLNNFSPFWSGCVWRQDTSIYLLVIPDDEREVFLGGLDFTFVQNEQRFDIVCLQTSDSYQYLGDCYSGRIETNQIFKISQYDPNDFDEKLAFDLYYRNNDPIKVPAASFYHLDINIEPSDAGTLNAEAIGDYEQGEFVEIDISVNNGYKFSHWSDTSEVKSVYRQVEMPENDLSITAKFTSTSISSDFGCFISTTR